MKVGGPGVDGSRQVWWGVDLLVPLSQFDVRKLSVLIFKTRGKNT